VVRGWIHEWIVPTVDEMAIVFTSIDPADSTTPLSKRWGSHASNPARPTNAEIGPA
jgi:hypothetical protein